jgi:hypothetical protein
MCRTCHHAGCRDDCGRCFMCDYNIRYVLCHMGIWGVVGFPVLAYYPMALRRRKLRNEP